MRKPDGESLLEMIDRTKDRAREGTNVFTASRIGRRRVKVYDLGNVQLLKQA